MKLEFRKIKYVRRLTVLLGIFTLIAAIVMLLTPIYILWALNHLSAAVQVAPIIKAVTTPFAVGFSWTIGLLSLMTVSANWVLATGATRTKHLVGPSVILVAIIMPHLYAPLVLLMAIGFLVGSIFCLIYR